MSAPETNVETQKRRHRPALIGIAAALIFGAIMFLAIFETSVDPDTAPEQDDAVTTEDGS